MQNATRSMVGTDGVLVDVCCVLCSTSEELGANCDSDETDLDNTKMTMVCWHEL